MARETGTIAVESLETGGIESQRTQGGLCSKRKEMSRSKSHKEILPLGLICKGGGRDTRQGERRRTGNGKNNKERFIWRDNSQAMSGTT
ncbi:hypothetical protein RUM43_001594, partial [Polyplax serrata]